MEEITKAITVTYIFFHFFQDGGDYNQDGGGENYGGSQQPGGYGEGEYP